MKIQINRRHLSLAVAVFILYLAISYWPSVAKLLSRVFSAAMPLLIGCVLAYIVNLLLKQYEHLFARIFKTARARKFQRAFGIVASYVTIVLIIVLVIHLVIPELIRCIRLLVANHSHVVNHFVAYFQQNSQFKDLWRNFDPRHLNWSKYGKYLTSGFGGTFKTVMSTASSIVSGVTTAVIATFFSIYLLVYKEKLAGQAMKLLDAYLGKVKMPLMHVLKTFDRCYSSYIVGQCKDAAILGFACFVGMTILRLPYAAMIGAVTCFTALIPIIGAILGASVGVVLIFAVSPVKALIFLVFIIVLQQFDNRITYPLVVGSSLGLPSVWVFAAVITGGGFSGILGMMLTVPLFAAVYQLVGENVRHRQTKQKRERQND